MRLHKSREESWGDLRLKYEEAPEPVVQGLNLPQPAGTLTLPVRREWTARPDPGRQRRGTRGS